jgi:galactokinase
MNRLRVSSPGRICLFGEHQDYLGLPVIACAISKRIYIGGRHRTDNRVFIDLPDIDQTATFTITPELVYTAERDYLRSAINVLTREGFTFSKGFNCRVHGTIPINAGASSSSALVVTWINFLARMSDQQEELDEMKIAEYAHRAEVLEFSEPGGMMDHYTVSVGNIIGLRSYPEIKLKKYDAGMGQFILGNSLESKDTKLVLARVKQKAMDIKSILGRKHPDFSFQSLKYEDIENFDKDIDFDLLNFLKGTIRNRDITLEAESLFEQKSPDHKYIGELLNEHQTILRDVLQISTPKIERMINAALDAGALGAKINGSGGGGCMFAYVTENADKVLEAVGKISPDVYKVTVDRGTTANVERDI